jgi:hypothetical protein
MYDNSNSTTVVVVDLALVTNTCLHDMQGIRFGSRLTADELLTCNCFPIDDAAHLSIRAGQLIKLWSCHVAIEVKSATLIRMRGGVTASCFCRKVVEMSLMELDACVRGWRCSFRRCQPGTVCR